MKLEEILLVLLLLFMLYHISNKEHLNALQATNLKFVEFVDAKAGFPFNDHLKRTAAELSATNDDIICRVAENENTFNENIICQGKYSPFISKEQCSKLGDLTHRHDYNTMQQTMCVLGRRK